MTTITTTDDGPRDREYWANHISASLRQAVENIIETGQLLIEAKASLAHCDFLEMVKDHLPFTSRTAQMLMKIARNPVLSNAKHVSLLPTS
jgi:hypothetical protein